MQNNKVNKGSFFITFFVISLLAEGVFIDIGFSLKLYMILTPFVLLYVLKKGIVDFLSYEKLYIVMSTYFILGSFFTELPLNSLKYAVVIFFSILCMVLFKNYLIKKSLIYNIDNIFTKAIFLFSLGSLLLYVLGVFSVGFNFYSAGGESVRFYGVMLDRSSPRLIGLGNDPNNFVFAVTLPWYFLAFKKKKTKFEFFTFVLLTICVLLTFSRGGWIGIFIPFLIYYMFHVKEINFKYLSLVLLTGIYIVYSNFATLYKLLDEGVENRLEIGTGSGRFDLWYNAINVFNDNIILGLGADMYKEIYGKYVHNTYLQILVDGGFIGFVLFILFLIGVYKQIKVIKRFDRGTGLYLVLSFYAILIQMGGLSIQYNESWIVILGFIGYKTYNIRVK